MTRSIKFISILFVTLIFIVVGLAVGGEALHLTMKNTLAFSKHTTILAVIRLSLMGFVVYFYPHLIRWRFKKISSTLNQQQLEKLSSRKYILGFFIIYELAIVHNGLGWIINEIVHFI